MKLTSYLLTKPLDNGYTLLVNCLSGAVDFLPNRYIKLLMEGHFNRLPKNLIQSLWARGYIFKSAEDEIKLLKQLELKYNKDSPFIDLVVCPTFDCNLACPYCFQKNLDKHHLYLSKESIPKLILALNKISSMFPKPKAIQLFGGEPLLPKNKPFIAEILVYAQTYKIPVAITTNGTTILHFKTLIKRFKDCLKVAQITIDGPPEIHNKRRISKNGKPTFAQILKGIEFLLSCNIAVHSRVNVDKSNIKGLPRLANILKNKGFVKNKFFKCSLAPVADHCHKKQSARLLNENELLEDLNRLKKKFPQMQILKSERIPKILKHLQSILEGTYSSPRFTYCQANRNGYFIFGPDGLIYPCSEACGHQKLAIGQFLPFFQMNDNLALWRQRTITKTKKCLNCTIAPLCGGGCSYAAYRINGDIFAPYCHEAQKVIKNYLKANKDSFFIKAKKSSAA